MELDNDHPEGAGDSELRVGEALPFDFYDANGGLLLAKGAVLESESQIRRLLERGKPTDRADHAAATPGRSNRPGARSVLRAYLRACDALEKMLPAPEAATEGAVRGMADALLSALDDSADIALACMVFPRSGHPRWARHGVNAALLSALMALAMKKPRGDAACLAAAALTMDLGLPPRQGAAPGPAELLRRMGVADPVWLACVEQRHERIDGSGRPLGLAGGQVSEDAQILAVADLYLEQAAFFGDRERLLPSQALRALLTSGREFIRAELASYLIRVLGIYPPGSAVRLHNGEIAIVTRRHRSGAPPVAQSVIGPRGAPYSAPVRRETEHQCFGIREPVRLDPEEAPFAMEVLWGSLAAA
jgi:hypothetical protein